MVVSAISSFMKNISRAVKIVRAHKLVISAWKAFEDGNVADAKNLLERVVYKTPNHPDAAYRLAYIYFIENDYKAVCRTLDGRAMSGKEKSLLSQAQEHLGRDLDQG